MTCTCAKCVSACRRIPGVFDPLEALAAIRAGHADDMMVVERPEPARKRWTYDYFDALMPRSLPRESVEGTPSFSRSHRNPMTAIGRCVFLDADERCEIHDSGFKPAECRAAFLCGPDDRPRSTSNILARWRTPVGRKVVDIWRKHMEGGDAGTKA